MVVVRLPPTLPGNLEHEAKLCRLCSLWRSREPGRSVFLVFPGNRRAARATQRGAGFEANWRGIGPKLGNRGAARASWRATGLGSDEHRFAPAKGAAASSPFFAAAMLGHVSFCRSGHAQSR